MAGPLLFLGAGKMGGAIAQGLLARGTSPTDLCLIDPALPSIGGIPAVASFADYQGPAPRAVILAIKPQLMDAVLPPLAAALSGTLLISIAAGKPLSYFEGMFGTGSPLVRAMPNLPAAVGAGLTGWIANAALGEAELAFTQDILSATGSAHRLETDTQIDAWTAVAGSGPAYVFHMMESLQAAAQELGFAPNLAAAMAMGTISGAAQLAASPQADGALTPFAELRKNVTSPGGTTAAGLEALMPGLSPLLAQTCQASFARAKALSV